MNNETRNEVLFLYNYVKDTDEYEKGLDLKWMLEHFEIDCYRKIEEAERIIKQEKANLETIKDVKEKLNIK